MNKSPELLVPAGGREQFEAALTYGADAIYLGGTGLNLRKASQGFTESELKQAVKEAHEKNVQVFYTLNALPFNHQLKEVKERLEILGNCDDNERVDALIIADPGVFALAREICPQIDIHLSTQAHTVNIESIKFWQKQGATRVNLARELDFKMIKEITTSLDIECEVFMHGAMCLALSGHCLLSMWANNRVANHGGCSQPCRFQYKTKEITLAEKPEHLEKISLRDTAVHLTNPEYKDEVLFIAEENDEFSTIWSPHEHCLIRYINYLKQINVASLKIEGRTKSPSYVAQVTDIYRTAIDRSALSMQERKKLSYNYKDLIKELASVASRPLSTGFFLPNRRIEAEPTSLVNTGKLPSKKIVGRVVEKLSDTSWLIDVRATWHDFKEIQILVPGFKRPSVGKYSLENHKGEHTSVLHPGMKGVLHCENTEIKEKLYIQSIEN